MGGRGNSSKNGGGGAQQQAQQQAAQGPNVDQMVDDFNNRTGLYGADGSPELQQFQSLHLSGTGSAQAAMAISDTISHDVSTDPNYNDGYKYYDVPMNNALAALGVSGEATVLNDADFDSYVSGTGQQVLYRGMSGTAAVDRLQNQTYNHCGSGIYGDGYYCSPSRSVANSYARDAGASRGTQSIARLALSPNARVITHDQLQQEMSKMSYGVRRAFMSTSHQGGDYGPNRGEALAALYLGYNVVQCSSGHTGYWYAVSADALVVSQSAIAVR